MEITGTIEWHEIAEERAINESNYYEKPSIERTNATKETKTNICYAIYLIHHFIFPAFSQKVARSSLLEWKFHDHRLVVCLSAVRITTLKYRSRRQIVYIESIGADRAGIIESRYRAILTRAS